MLCERITILYSFSTIRAAREIVFSAAISHICYFMLYGSTVVDSFISYVPLTTPTLFVLLK